METLAIYDNKGTIFFQGIGYKDDPVGLQFIRVNVPEGKMLIGVDVSTETHKPIYVDVQKTPIEEEVEALRNKLTQAESDNLTTLEALADVYEMILPLLG